MNISLFASAVNVWLLAGWTMIHFLWVGMLVGIVALLCRLLLSRVSANIRYATALACLSLLAVFPIAIVAWLHEYSPSVQIADAPERTQETTPVARTQQVSSTESKNGTPIELTAAQPVQHSATPAVAAPGPQLTHAAESPNAEPAVTVAPAETDAFSLAVFAVNTSVHYLPWLWLIGTPITFALTATGIIGTRRLHRASRLITEGPVAEILAQIAASLRLGQRVTVAVCDRIAAPVLIGILRPIILLPPAALTGYSPEEIEMVLLHELAHVRRWDNLVNLMQRIIESLLFFHPAVWLISGWARREREACCDAAVIARTNHPHAYAELLVALAAQMPRSVLFHPAASSAMAAGPLRSRIRRILQLDDDPMLVSGKSFALVLGVIITAAMLAAVYLPKIGLAEPSTAEAAIEAQSKSKRESTNAEKPAAETRDELVKSLQDVRGKIKTKFEDYLDIATRAGRPNVNEFDPETDLLLRDIADTQAKVQSLTTAYFQLQTDYMVAKGELIDPALLEAQADEAIKHDSQYADLTEKAKAQTAPSDGSEYLAVEKYRAEFKKRAVREMQAKPNAPLQQLTQRFRTQAGSMQNQIAFLTQTVEQKKKELQKRLEKSVELETRGNELKQLEQMANDTMVKLKDFDIDGQTPEQTTHAQPDNWPMGVAFPSPKEGEIAARAWRQLHLKVIPASKTERAAPNATAIKVVGTNMPPGLDSPVFLLSLNGIDAKDFDQLDAALRTLRGQKVVAAKCITHDTAHGQLQMDVALNGSDESKPKLETVSTPAGEAAANAEPSPASSEHAWPFGESFATPKDAVTSARAWRRLKLKIVPASGEEQSKYKRGLKVVGGTVNVLGTSGPFLLESVAGVVTHDFDQLAAALTRIEENTLAASKKIEGHDFFVVKVVHIADQGGAQPIEFAIPANEAARKAAENLPQLEGPQNAETPLFGPAPATYPPPAQKPSNKFPSLESQKLADLAWKRLGLELEQIRDDDLKRAKAFGYDGGVKVTDKSNPSNAGYQYNEIQSDDILVGLHVWPTASLQDVAGVLKRDDLAELNPLKFYVVRPGRPQEGMFSSAPKEDTVVTGRIPLKDSHASVPTNNAPTPQAALDWTAPVGSYPDATSLIALPGETRPPPLPNSPQEFSKMQAERMQQLVQIAQAMQPSVARESQERTATQPTKSETIGDAVASHAVPKMVQDSSKQTATKAIVSSEYNVTKSTPNTPSTTSPYEAKQPFIASTTAEPANPKPDAASSESSAAKPSPKATNEHSLLPDRERARRWAKPTPTESVFVAYNIPTDIKEDALRYFDRPGVRTMSDGRGRYVVQASQEWHDGFARLLQATPKWRDSAAAKERAAAPIVKTKIDGEDALEWRSVGLTLMSGGNVSPSKGNARSPVAASKQQAQQKLLAARKALATGNVDLAEKLTQAANSLGIPESQFLPDEDRPSLVAWDIARAKQKEGYSQPAKELFSEQNSHVRVVGVVPGSPAAWSDIRPEDVLTDIGSFSANTMPETESLLEAIGKGLRAGKTKVRVSFVRYGTGPGSGIGVSGDFALGPEDFGAKASEPEPKKQTDRPVNAPVAEAQTSKRSADSSARPAASAKPAVRYEGKTFDEWRTAWQTELSTEKRLATVKALAAFGANGYGREAAEAILDVADQYDWAPADNSWPSPPNTTPSTKSAEEELMSAVYSALGGGPASMQIKPKYWLLNLIDRLKSNKDDTRLVQLSSVVIPQLRLQSNPDIDIDALLELSRGPASPARNAALMALAAIDPGHKNPRVTARFQELLRSDSSTEVCIALQTLINAADLPKTDWLSLLLHRDEAVRDMARYAIQNGGWSDPKLVESLQKVLQDPQRKEDHLAAIRGLAVIGRLAADAYAALEKLMMDPKQPMPIRVAAMNALTKLTNDNSHDAHLREAFGSENKARENTPEFRQDLIKFDQAIQAEKQ